MIGNNSAAPVRPIANHRSLPALEVVLADGTTTRLGPLSDVECRRSVSRSPDLGRIHRAVRDTVATSAGDHRPISAHSAQGQRVQPRRVRAGVAGATGGLGRRPLTIQPRQADRRLQGRWRWSRRPIGGRSSCPAGAGRPLVRHDPRGAERLAEIVATDLSPSRCSTG